jgi:hypothetical protein
VNTRLRYVLKLEETTGSPRLVVITQSYSRRSVSVTSASTNLNAPNGVFIKNVTASGEDSLPMTENGFVVNVT